MRVLLIDDEEELVSTVVERLGLRGIQAEGVTGGGEALARLARASFDVIVLDVKMPGMNGLEVLREVRRRGVATPVLLLSGHGSDRETETGIRDGAFGYIVKPVNIDDLIAKMRQAAAGSD